MPARIHPAIPAALAAALALPVLPAGAAAPAPPADQPAVFRTMCVGCHSVDASGRFKVLDAMRATPEEWDNVLRRMGRRGLALSEAERHAVVKQICRTRSLAPEEHAAVAHLAVSAAANLKERVPDHGSFRQTCTSCHSYAKVASHRRTPEAWAALRDFHLGMFPAAITQSYREMNWWDEAVTATGWLAKALPYETPEWKRWRARKQPLTAAGTWVVAGHMPGAGPYEATMRLAARGDDEYALTREVRWPDGRVEKLAGKATLFGGGALRAEWREGAAAVRAAYTLGAPGAALAGAWTTHRAIHRYGRETGARLRAAAAAPTVLRLDPPWVRAGQGRVDVVATVDGPAPAGWRLAPADRAVRVLGKRVVDATHVRFTLAVDPKARVGTLALGPAGSLLVARGVDYVKVTPEKATARLGGLAVPPDGVPFEAIAMSVGPDGKRHTDDDMALGPVPASWAIAECFETFEDDDAARVGHIGPDGLFMPADEGEAEGAYTKGKNGNVWVVATYRPPAGPPMQGRAYLLVTAPDMVKPIR